MTQNFNTMALQVQLKPAESTQGSHSHRPTHRISQTSIDVPTSEQESIPSISEQESIPVITVETVISSSNNKKVAITRPQVHTATTYTIPDTSHSVGWDATSTIMSDVSVMQPLSSIAKPSSLSLIAKPSSIAESIITLCVPTLTDFHQEALKGLSFDTQSSIFSDTNKLSDGVLTRKSIDFIEYQIEKYSGSHPGLQDRGGGDSGSSSSSSFSTSTSKD